MLCPGTNFIAFQIARVVAVAITPSLRSDQSPTTRFNSIPKFGKGRCAIAYK